MGTCALDCLGVEAFFRFMESRKRPRLGLYAFLYPKHVILNTAPAKHTFIHVLFGLHHCVVPSVEQTLLMEHMIHILTQT